MRNDAIIKLAAMAHEYDMVGQPHKADVVNDVMMRLAQAELGKVWNGVKQMGEGVADDAKAASAFLAAPFEAAGSAADAAWNSGLKNVPQAVGQSAAQSAGRVENYTGQEMQNFGQGFSATAGPGGTGLIGAVAVDAAHGLQNAAQGYVGGLVDQRIQQQQDTYVESTLQQAIRAHQKNGTGWQVIHNATQYGQFSPQNAAKLKQRFEQAAAQFGSH